MSKLLENVVGEFAKLPGVGAKTAMRYAYAVMGMSAEDAEEFSRAITDVKTKVHYCRECGNFTEDDVCDICRRRSKDVICVVTYPKDVTAMEKSHCFGGVYHVLHGTISPLSGRGADDIRIKELLARLNGVKEVILATNPDVEMLEDLIIAAYNEAARAAEDMKDSVMPAGAGL